MSRPRSRTWRRTPPTSRRSSRHAASRPRSWRPRPIRRRRCSRELRTPGARRTVEFYAHYDGQPVGQKGWIISPFTPSMRTALPEAVPVDWRAATGAAGSGLAPLRPLRRRRQGLHPGAAVRLRRAEGARAQALGQHQAALRRRGGTGLAALREARGRQPGAAEVRRPDHGRRPDAPERQADGQLRQPRHHEPHPHRLRPDEAAARRPLRQLGAEPVGHDRRPRHEPARRRRPHPHPALLRRRDAAERGRPGGHRRHAAGRGGAQAGARPRAATSARRAWRRAICSRR